MTDESPAPAYRRREALRMGAIAAREAALRGSPAASLDLMTRWDAVLPLDVYGVPLQPMGADDGRQEEG